MRIATIAAALLAVTACGSDRPAEDPSDWFDQGSDVQVLEHIEFTDQNYDFPGAGDKGVGSDLLPAMPGGQFVSAIAFGAGEHLPDNGCEYASTTALPLEVEGIVTLHPRFYYKTQGCDRNSDEKYYGSYFIQDATGGVFVVGDSKVAHFDMGDRVRLRVRGVRTVFGLDMVYAHDVLEVERNASAIYYQVVDGKLGSADIGEVRRVTGTVVSEPDTFGQFAVKADGSTTTCTETMQSGCHFVTIDSEVSRRGLGVEIGDRVQATGPVLYSYSTYTIVIMKVGQLTQLD